MSYPLVLTGQAVNLREFAATDLDDALGILGDDRVTASLSFDSRTADQVAEMLSGAMARAQQSPRTEIYLAVTRHQDPDDRMIGFARLGLTGVKAAKLGYAIAVSEWGNGYATDAAGALVAYGFEHLGLHRITAAIGPGNAASVAVVSRLGFQREGVLRDHVFTNGAWRDSELFSLLEPEWAGRQSDTSSQRVRAEAAEG